MPRDKRLYMTFPIDFPQHPKVKPLSDTAKWTFVEMNGYSRQHGLDGNIPAAAAHATWKRTALAALVASHPVKPLVMLVDDMYVIRDYAEHQLTLADIADLHEKRARAGAMGGKAKASARAKPKQNVPESESRSESESGIQTDVTELPESSQVSDGSNSRLDAVNDVVQQRARRAGIGNLAAVCDALAVTTGEPVSPLGAVLLAEAIVSKAKRVVNNVDAYIATTCRRTPAEVQQAYFDLDIGAVA